MPPVAYSVQIVGTNRPLKIAQMKLTERYLLQVLLPDVGMIIQNRIKEKIKNYPFRNQIGQMLNAVKVRLIQEQLAVEVYNDTTLAPHAIWQEIGVRKHKMLYLIKHKNPNTIPYVIRNGRFEFAGRNSSFYGAPDLKFAKITDKSFDRINPINGKPSWENPGYPGKYFYRDGLIESMEEVRGKFKEFTFRLLMNAGENPSVPG